MESQDLSPPSYVDASRTSIGFPLGTALLLLIVFSLSGVFSCVYHWDKLASLRRSFADDIEGQLPPSKSIPSRLDMKKYEKQSVPVIMAGDEIPKFMALPCPCEPPREEKSDVKFLKPPKLPRFPVPLY